MVGLQDLILVIASAALVSAANSGCEAIKNVIEPAKVLDTSNLSLWSSNRPSYWTAQAAAVTPACFVQPAHEGDVSKILKVLNKPEHQKDPGCKFAIKSGGHTTWAGAANIEGGVTIDLSRLKQITVYQDRGFVSLGPGNTWQDVFDKLEPMGLAVAGGRWGNVGVGGLLLGGGLSFFQGSAGPACDGVMNHRIVLADGQIINANAREQPDLHRALKGGSNNFGIVTRFDVKLIRHSGDVWSGMIASSPVQKDSSIVWFEQFANSSTPMQDPNGMVMFSLGSFLGSSFSGSLFTYSQPVKNPAVAKGLYDSSLVTTMGMTTLSAVARNNAVSTPGGGRTLWGSFSFTNSAKFMEVALELANEKSADMPLFSSGISLIFQPLWKSARAQSFASTGGNALGLENEPRDLVIVLVMASWVGAANDGAVRDGMKAFIDAAQAKAFQMGVGSRYVYMNYAADFQDVIGGYGQASRDFLVQTAVKYDPTALFQRQVPGGFKLLPQASRL